MSYATDDPSQRGVPVNYNAYRDEKGPPPPLYPSVHPGPANDQPLLRDQNVEVGRFDSVVSAQDTRWSWLNMVCAFFTMLCCSCFGFIAIVFDILAYVDYKSRDLARYKRKHCISRVLVVVGILLGVAVIVLIYYFQYATFAAIMQMTQNQNKGTKYDSGYN